MLILGQYVVWHNAGIMVDQVKQNEKVLIKSGFPKLISVFKGNCTVSMFYSYIQIAQFVTASSCNQNNYDNTGS